MLFSSRNFRRAAASRTSNNFSPVTFDLQFRARIYRAQFTCQRQASANSAGRLSTFSTLVHIFAQTFSPISVDAKIIRVYLAPQIEPEANDFTVRFRHRD